MSEIDKRADESAAPEDQERLATVAEEDLDGVVGGGVVEDAGADLLGITRT